MIELLERAFSATVALRVPTTVRWVLTISLAYSHGLSLYIPIRTFTFTRGNLHLQARVQADLVQKRKEAEAKYEEIEKRNQQAVRKYRSSSKGNLERIRKQALDAVARHRLPGRVCLTKKGWSGLPDDFIDTDVDLDALLLLF